MKRAMVAKNLKQRKIAGSVVPSEEKWRDVRNSERDLQKHFVRFGYSLPVPIKKLEHTLCNGESLVIEYINPSDWLTFLLKKYPGLIAGGTASLQDQLEGFWDAYRLLHPGHEIFNKQCSLGQVVPLCFWGDEGRGPRRSGYLEATLECPLGLSEQNVNCSCHEVLRSMPTHWLPPEPAQCGSLTSKMACIDKLGTNSYGHSFLKRYYLFGLPGYIYDGEPDIVEKHLKTAAEDLASLFRDGIVIDNKRFFGALVGSKGDMKFQSHTIAWMTRSYSNLGTRNLAPICSLCKAGSAGVAMEDVSLEPTWKNTMYQERPWNVEWEPCLSQVPFDPVKPEFLYKLDFFHCFKVGLGRDLAGSSLIWMCRLQVYDFPNSTQNVEDRLKRCHSHFKLWAMTEKYSPSLRSFTKAFLNHKTSVDAAWTNSKGSDTMILLKYVRFQLSLVIRDESPNLAPRLQILTLLRDVIDHGIQMCEMLYSHNLLLPRQCASRLYLHIMILIRGFKRVAAHCLQHQEPGFRLKPKLHALAHIGLELREVLQTPAVRVINPLIWSCEMNEDHIGHVARVSRKLATRTLALRMAQRYLLKSRAVFRRHFNKKRFCKPSKR